MNFGKQLSTSLIFPFLSIQTIFAEITIKGHITTPGMDPEPLSGVPVELIDQADNSRVFKSTTDSNGFYTITVITTSVEKSATRSPATYQLLQNYPNPFNPSTVITWTQPRPGYVKLEIYNILGQRIRTLFESYQTEGIGRVLWDGTNDQGQGMAAGVYIYSLFTSDGSRLNKKMLLLDGHTGVSGQDVTFSGRVTHDPPAPKLDKSLANTYLLRVKAKDVEWYEQSHEISNNMTIDLSLHRTVTDIDKNVYRTIKIGDQWWMAENLKVIHYLNGDMIPNTTDSSKWVSKTSSALCYYDNEQKFTEVYGALYNWYALVDERSIAPGGWHVPTDDEWKKLEIYLGMSPEDADTINWRGTNAGGKLKSTGTEYWNSPNEGATNESGFSAVPNGYRNGNDATFRDIKRSALFGTVSEADTDNMWVRIISNGNARVYRNSFNKMSGLAVRCVKDDSTVKNTPPTASFTVDPSSGTTNTNFSFDASGCTDKEDDGSVLQVRWDFHNDGSWDTDYTTTKTVTKKYSLVGNITVKLEVMDSGGLTATATREITVSNEQTTGTVTDIDGNVYNTVKIGNQWWMAENLRVTHYRNGEDVPEIISPTVWVDANTPGYCYYNNNSSTAIVYGALYNWYAVQDSRKIAPAGWHVATDAEWNTLVNHLGGETVAGGKLKAPGTTRWNSPNTGATNESGFSAVGAGYRDKYTGSFGETKINAYIWTASSVNINDAAARRLNFNYANIFDGNFNKGNGFSVRCVKD